MDPTSLVVVSAAPIVAAAARQALAKLRGRGSDEPPVAIEFGDNVVFVEGERDEALLQQLLQEAQEVSSGTSERIEQAKSDIASAALAFDPDGLFRTARARIDLTFRLRLGMIVVLAMILAVSLAGALAGAITGNLPIAAGAGGIAVVDAILAVVFKPIRELHKAIVATQRIDLIHLQARQLLGECQQHKGLRLRIDCQQKVWATINKQMERLA
jgi:hypothetical protein